MNKWTKEEDDILLEIWDKPLDFIKSKLKNRTARSITTRILNTHNKKRSEIKKTIKDRQVNTNLEVLLNDSLESFYWIGFILADGCFVKNRFEINLSTIDEDHLKSLASYVNINNFNYCNTTKTSMCKISAQDSFICPKIKEKFDFKKRKTYNPPDTSKWNFTDDQLISMFIGFIDGDGHIRKTYGSGGFLIRISLHNSWINVLDYFSNKIEKITNIKTSKTNIPNSSKQACLLLGDSRIAIYLKEFILKHNLPVLNRKWDKVDINFISRKKKSVQNIENVKKLYNLSDNEISKILGISRRTVCRIRKENNIITI